MFIQWGLQDPPTPRYLFVGEIVKEGRTALWYEFNHDTEEQIPVFQRALVGLLGNLILHVKEHKGKKAVKLDVLFQADKETFVVRAGVDTNFMRSFLLSIDQVEDFSRPLTLVLVPGNDGKVVFSNVHLSETNYRIRYEYDAEAPLLPIINKIQRILGVAVTKVNKDWEVVTTEAAKSSEEVKSDTVDNPPAQEPQPSVEQPPLPEENPEIEEISSEIQEAAKKDQEEAAAAKPKRGTKKK